MKTTQRPHRGASWSSWFLATALVGSASGCAGGTSKPAVPEESRDATASSTPAESSHGEAMSAEELEALAAIEASEPETPAEPTPPDGQREIVYRMSPEGLKVEVEGATFAVAAQSYKKPAGYGVEVTVKATAQSEGLLFAPENGPLAFGGRVVRQSGRVDTFGDQKSGSGTLALGPKTPQTFSRKWPSGVASNVSLLSPGDTLELQVGLWGYEPSGGARKPVRKFATVTMKASAHGAHPVVDAPPR